MQLEDDSKLKHYQQEFKEISINGFLDKIDDKTKFKAGGVMFVAGLMIISLALIKSVEVFFMSVVGTVLFLNGLIFANKYRELK